MIIHAVIAFFLLLITILVGLPVIYCFGLAVVYLLLALGYDFSFIISTGYSKTGSIVLLCVPLFILCGGIVEKGQMGKALVEFINKFLGRIKGSLAIVGVVTCALFGSICGSGTATLTSIGSILSPRMHDAGYPAGNIGAVFACAAPLGLLIPPSVTQIMYAWTTGQSVLACFMATLIPGIILTVLLSVTNYFMLRKIPTISVTAKQSVSEWKSDLWPVTKRASGTLMLAVIIFGGIYGGFMTPTEAAAVSAFCAVLIAIFIYKGIRFKDLRGVITETGTTTGVCMMSFFFANVLSKILTMMGFPQMIMNLFTGLTDSSVVILIMINLLLVVVGMLMDDISGILLCAPILMPLLGAIDVHPVQFAAVIGVNLGMAAVTPPSAPFLYIACRTCGCELKDMLKPTLMMIIFAYLPTLILVTYVPELSLFLPRVLGLI